MVVSSPLPSELHLDANRSNPGKKADLVPFSSSSPSLSSPSLTNYSPGSFVFTTSTSWQLLAAHSDQTIINSNVTIGLEDSLNLANPIVNSEGPFSLTVYGTFGEARGEEREDREERTGESRGGEGRRGEVSGWMIMSDSIC